MTIPLWVCVLIIFVVGEICGFIEGRLSVKRFGSLKIEEGEEKDNYILEIDDLDKVKKYKTVKLRVKTQK